ncbi:MAG: hypothetical protein WBF34_23390 [Streptosporangiaceae bacterium]|jgi:hypothetical protein
MGYPFHADLLGGIYLAAEPAGYDIALSALTPSRGEDRAIETLLDYRCEALLLLGSEAPAARLEGTAAPGREDVVVPHLIVRGTTAAPALRQGEVPQYASLLEDSRRRLRPLPARWSIEPAITGSMEHRAGWIQPGAGVDVPRRAIILIADALLLDCGGGVPCLPRLFSSSLLPSWSAGRPSA